MSKNKKEISTELSEDQIEILNKSYPVSEEESNSLSLPRFGMLSKDITEVKGTGKNKAIKVIQAAGTFFTEKDLGETAEDGRKKWTKEFIEDEKVDLVIVFHRRQLRMYDSSLEKFYSTPIFDSPEQIIPLYLDKQVVKRDNQMNLQKLFPAQTLKGKPTSKLKEEVILYVIYDGELYQCNISQSSKWEFKDYKKNINPSTLITTISSKEDTFGDNTFRKMIFKKKRSINGGEFDEVVVNQKMLRDKVESDKRFFVPELPSGNHGKPEDDDGLNAFDVKSS